MNMLTPPTKYLPYTLCILFIISIFAVCGHVVDSGDKDDAYGIIIDAGSSGSRIYVFQWKPSRVTGILPQIDEIFNYKIKPGISSFVDDKDGLQKHILSLIESCKNKVPDKKHASTYIYLMATAGMRLLLESKANTIFQEIDAIFRDRSLNPFSYARSNSRILSGEEEGVFAWIAVNYLKGYFNNKAYESVGILEMGGASVQVTFVPEGNILAFKFPVHVAGRSFSLYSHSYLYYGQEKVDERVRQILYRTPANANKTSIDNPCRLEGDIMLDNKVNPNMTIQFNGSGNPEACQKLINVFVYKAPYNRCYPKPCAIGPAYQPTTGTEKPFYALGAFGKNIAPRGVLDAHHRFTPKELKKVTEEYCNKTLEQVQNETGRTDQFVSIECLMGLYIPDLLTVGFGFSTTTQRIIATDMIGNREAHWPLGAIIYELEKNDLICPAGERMGASTSGAATLRHIRFIYILSVIHVALEIWRRTS